MQCATILISVDAQVSSTFRDLISDHNLWARILQRVCAVDSLFLPSYPISSMSTKELQRAALAPSLWRKRISKNVIQDLDKYYESIDASVQRDTRTHPEPLLVKDDFYIGDAFLVPGGRFVIAAAWRERPLYLYDLGPLGSAKGANIPVASGSMSLEVEDDDRCGWSLCVVPQGDTLRSATFRAWQRESAV